MLRQIAPVFFTRNIPATLAYYTGKLGFACLGTWQDPPVYAIVARDQQVIHSGLFPLRAPSRARTFIFAGCKYSPHPSAAPSRLQPIRINTRTNCSTRTCSLKMPTHSMPSTPPKVWNHSRTWQHALALPRVRGEGLRWPSAGLRREPVIFFQAFVVAGL